MPTSLPPEQIAKIMEAQAIQLQIYELQRRLEMVLSSMLPPRQPSKPFNPATWKKERAEHEKRNAIKLKKPTSKPEPLD